MFHKHIGISHLIVCPRLALAVFQDFDSPPHGCEFFPSSFSFHTPFFLFPGSTNTRTLEVVAT
jgi:hypothetical protein